MLGAPAGVLLNSLVGRQVFSALLGVCVGTVGVLLWTRARASDPRAGTSAYPKLHPLVLGLIGFGVAAVSGLFGLGGPLLSVLRGLRGDPVRLDLATEVRIDALELHHGRGDVGVVTGGAAGGGVAGRGPVFDVWLLVERRRLAGICEGVLRHAALRELSVGGIGEAPARRRSRQSSAGRRIRRSAARWTSATRGLNARGARERSGC